MLLGGLPAEACIEGLAWGMPLDEVVMHLGETHQSVPDQPHRYTSNHVQLDQIHVPRVTFEVTPRDGLKTLAYEFVVDDMTEVLASLRARHGQPLMTTVDEGAVRQQIWVWNTGEDLITAVKNDNAKRQQFLIAYRPIRLRPDIL